mmetsp:Transcript_19588/g.35952  ORF Transcript_19588/g.35952 Transcript_19588/m.35952 type:complete len:207 (-) Transcript_19588:20-640(-)
MKVLCLAALLGLAVASQLTPIPTAGQYGFVLGPQNATYTLDVYYDHLCSGSAQAFPGLLQYFLDNSSWLRVKIHIFPLPYHHFAFEVAEAGRYIQDNYPDRFVNFTSFFFDNQDTYLSDALAWNYNQTLWRLSNDTQTATGVSSSEVFSALLDSSNNWNTRVAWKFATSNGITGTPQYQVNGVWAPDASDNVSARNWKDYFNNLDS